MWYHLFCAANSKFCPKSLAAAKSRVTITAAIPVSALTAANGAKFNRLIWKLVAEDFKDGGRTEEMSFSRLRDYAATTRGVHINHGKPFWESRGCAFSVPETRNGLKMIKGSCRHAYFSPCQAPPEPNFASLYPTPPPICIQDGILHGKKELRRDNLAAAAGC